MRIPAVLQHRLTRKSTQDEHIMRASGTSSGLLGVYVCMCVCVYVCMCVCVYVCMCVYVCVCAYVSSFICILLQLDCLGLLLGCWASSEHCERLDVLRTIAFLVPSISIAFLLLSISIAFLFPFLKCHLISRHHGEIYTTRSVQSDRTSNASYRFSHFGIHVPLNLYNFNPNFSLPVLLKV